MSRSCELRCVDHLRICLAGPRICIDILMSPIPSTRPAVFSPRRLISRSLLPFRLLWRSLQWFARLGLALLLAAWGLVLVAWLVLHWGILPHIEQWRGPLETQASLALGVTVKLGRIEVRSSGWAPSIELGQVTLLDAQGHPTLVLPKVTAAVAPQSLLRLEMRFAQLVIDGAQLEVKRDPQGRIFVAGLEAHDNPAHRAQALDWLFKQTEFVIRNASVRWIDEQRQAPSLLMSDVQLVIRNGFRRHDIRFDATPPAGWGERLTMRGRFTQPLLARAGAWQRWSGQAYADLPQADVQALRLYMQLPFELKQGQGAVRAWMGLREGQLESATADVALRSVEARLAPDLEPLHLEQVQGRFLAKRSAQELQLDAVGVSFTTQDSLSWPVSSVSVKLQQRADSPVTGGHVTADAFDLALLSQVATRLPLGDAVNRLLRETAPKGQLQALDLRWQGPVAAPTTYQVKARLLALSLAAKPAPDPLVVGRPGVHNARLDVQANQNGGSATVNLNDGWFELPGVFSQPVLPIQRLSANVDWRIEPVKNSLPKVSVQWAQVQFANADMQGELSGNWRTGGGAGFGKGQRLPGRLVLDGKLAQGDVAQVARYVPQRIPEPVRDYLSRALTQGRMSQGSLRVQGDLSDFPFTHAKTAAEGEFRFGGKVQGATFAYVPDVPAHGDAPAWTSPWPALTEIAGEVLIDRDQLLIRRAQARVLDVALSQVNGVVRDLGQKGRTTLEIEGEGRGELANMVRFVNTSPVGGWTGNPLARSTVNGDSDLKLALTLPIFDLPASLVKGSVVMRGNDLRLRPDLPLLVGTRGRLDFTQAGFSVLGASARVFGGEASFSGGTQADRSVRISGQGQATAEALQASPELGGVARLAGYFSGQTTYRIEVALHGGRPELNVSSNLVGWSSQLPAPLRKTSEGVWPLRYQTRLMPETVSMTSEASHKPYRDSVQLDIGGLLQAQYVREWSGDPEQITPRVLRGALGVGTVAPAMGSNGVSARLVLPAVNLDEWAGVASRVLGGANDGVPEATANGSYAPTQFNLTADEILRGPLRLNDVQAQARWERGEWRMAINAQQTQGEVQWRPVSNQQAGQVRARLSRLALVAPPANNAETQPSVTAPTSLPALDLVVDDFVLRGKRLGRLEVQAANVDKGAAADWHLQRLALTTPEAKLSATGQWAAATAGAEARPASERTPSQTQMDFKLEVSDAGGLLERLGHAKAVRGGKGELAGQLVWNGSPLSPDPLSMSGHMVVDMGAGQFLKVDPGAGRLLSVLSLQSLPRRLLLDFRDVFQEGFAFDNLAGDITMSRGVASTNNLRMRGVQAAVLMEGQASLVDETQDLRVVVVPEINAGTASLAYAVINPALGLGTFLAQMFLRKPLTEANTREFHVTGPWADPKVKRVPRAGQTTPEDGSSAAAASAPAASAAPSKP